MTHYFLAFMLRLFAGSVTAVKIAQIILGALHATLLGAVARKMMGRGAGLVVGFLAAAYGPFVATEPMILREGSAMLFATAALYLALRALDTDASGSLRTRGGIWLVAGIVLGTGALMKETGFVFMVAVWLWVVARRLFLPAGLLLIGFIAGLSPLILRNLAVGVSPFAFSSLGSVNFIMANAADSPAGGVLFTVPPSFKAIIESTHGRLLDSVIATLETYNRQPMLFVSNVWAKFSAIWSNIEQPDNFSYAYLQMHSYLLRMLPRFVCIWLPAALGIIILVTRWSARRIRALSGNRENPREYDPETDTPRPLFMGLILFILVVHASAQSLAPVMSRYRLVLVPFLMLPAGWVLTEVAMSVARGRWGRLTRPILGLSILGLIWFYWPANAFLRDRETRPNDFVIGAVLRAERGDFAGAYDDIERGIAFYRSGKSPVAMTLPKELFLRRSRLILFTDYGRFHEDSDDWDILVQATPNDPFIKKLLNTESREQSKKTPNVN